MTFFSFAAPANIYHEVASFIPRMLIQKGIDRIGELDLLELIQNMSSIEHREFPHGFLIGSQCRTGAVNFVESGLVYVNSLSLEQIKTLDEIRVLLTHESLEALGYEDNNYELSIVLYMLWKKAPSEYDLPEKLLKPFRRLIQTESNRQFHIAGGGISAVGGGGEGFAIIEKAEILWLLWSDKRWLTKYRYERFSTSFDYIFRLRFEDAYSCNQETRVWVSDPQNNPSTCFDFLGQNKSSSVLLLKSCFDPLSRPLSTIVSVRRSLIDHIFEHR